MLHKLLLAATLAACVTLPKPYDELPYDMHAPYVTQVLPNALHEISGIARVDERTLACIQDENGVLFFYDLFINKITHQYNFAPDGDYEGVGLVNDTLYVLRSDGQLYEITHLSAANQQVNCYDTDIPAANNEGLCFDVLGKKLLIAPKGKVSKEVAPKDQRMVYGFDLTTKTLIDTPIYQLNVSEVKQFAAQRDIKLPLKTSKKTQHATPVVKLKTSAIAIHPISKQVYLLSAADYLLLVFDQQGNLQHLTPLDPHLFNKAEGITFLANGDMLVCNEGQTGIATLLRFKYKF